MKLVLYQRNSFTLHHIRKEN